MIVVGTGNAALSSAISAKENGSEVLVLEKAPKEKEEETQYLLMEQ